MQNRSGPTNVVEGLWAMYFSGGEGEVTLYLTIINVGIYYLTMLPKL